MKKYLFRRHYHYTYLLILILTVCGKQNNEAASALSVFFETLILVGMFSCSCKHNDIDSEIRFVSMFISVHHFPYINEKISCDKNHYYFLATYCLSRVR